MTEPNEFPPVPPNPDLPPAGETPFIDRYHIHPLLFAFGSLFVIFILYQVVGAVLTLVIAGTPEVTPENAPLMRWLIVCGQVAFIFIPTIFLARLGFSHPGDVFRFRTPGVVELALAFVSLFSLQEVFTSYQFFQDKLPLPDSVHRILDPLKKILEDVTANLLHASSTAELVAVIIVVAVVPAIVEEMLFRGFIQKTFERVLSPAAAAILTGVIFGLYHLNPFEIVPLIGLGIFFAFLRHRSQTLFLPMAAHFFNNLLAVVVAYYGVEDSALAVTARKEVSDTTELINLILFAVVFAVSFAGYLRMTRRIVHETP